MSNLSLQEQLQQVRRNHILDAAIVVIAERGFERTTIRQIAKQANVADGTIYNYFDNKAAIMTAIVSRATAGERRELDFAKAAQIDFATFVRHYMPQRMREVEAEMPTMKIILAETLNNADLRKQVNDSIYTPMFTIAEMYIQHLMDEGQIESGDPKLFARMMAAPIFGLLMLRLLGDEHVDANWETYGETVAEQLAGLMTKG
ncbi:MAG: TetR/AcrR family transcriptional regulator [Candidatus Promineifilaceae bacterium]